MIPKSNSVSHSTVKCSSFINGWYWPHVISALTIDFWASFRSRFVSLCRKTICPSDLHALAKPFYAWDSELRSPKDTKTADVILDSLLLDMHRTIEEAKKVLEGVQIVSSYTLASVLYHVVLWLMQLLVRVQTVVFDNPRVDVQAKYMTRLERRSLVQRSRKHYFQAEKDLQRLQADMRAAAGT